MKKLLVVIDYQNDFVNGSLGFQEAVALEDYLADLIKEYHNNNDDVIFTYDTHQKNYLTTQEGKIFLWRIVLKTLKDGNYMEKSMI